MKRLLCGFCLLLSEACFAWSTGLADYLTALVWAAGALWAAAGVWELVMGDQPRVDAGTSLVPRVVVDREGGR